MPIYKAPLKEIRFLLHDVFAYEKTVAGLPDYGEATPDTVDAVLEEAGKFCEKELQPLNLPGDTEGCHYENGAVRTPKGFKEAYTQFREGGWCGLTADPKFGGQGLPKVVGFAVEEMITSANMSFGMYPGLSAGAYNALELYGSDEIKSDYLPKLVDGTWSGTMCLTEPQCGTDLGLIRTKAVPADDGSFRITGTKIFISAGEHDLTGNILHLVLAKLSDAPPGTRGISLFLVPKFLPKKGANGLEAGAANGVRCGAIEHKMGIKASATCVINFDESKGWLVGETHKGMRAMFAMMNAARLGVAIQGLALAEVAYQNGANYARDRLQGRSLAGAKFPDKPADPILVHPDVRRMLLKQRAVTEAARALAYWSGMQLDIHAKHADAAARTEAEDFVALMTPIMKAFFTDHGFASANDTVQVHGGHGYIHDYGVEQFVRDARIAQIYEGANGIQALDLIGRKLPMHGGRLLRRFFHPLQAFLEQNMADSALGEFTGPLVKAFSRLQQLTLWVAQQGLADPEEAGAAASEYLRFFGLVALGWMWCRMVKAAQARIAAGDDPEGFYADKIAVARFFFQKLLPETAALGLSIMAGKKPMMALKEAAF